MSDYREECIRHKNVQRGIEDARPVGNKRKTASRPYRIEYQWTGRSRWAWSGRYVDLKTALQAFDTKVRKIPTWSWQLLENGNVIRSYTYTEVKDAPAEPSA